MSKNLKDAVILKKKLLSYKKAEKYRKELMDESLETRNERWKRTLDNKEKIQIQAKAQKNRMKTKSAMQKNHIEDYGM